MCSIPEKRQKLCDEVKTNTEDRISNLPSNLISHILSFLPTKYAVGTSIFSNNWKQQWTSITNVDFDDGLLSKTRKSKTTLSQQRSFVNFVYRVLLLLKVSHLHKFRLKCSQVCDISHINAWVSVALSRDVQHLDLLISLKEKCLLPCDLFKCRTLVVLKLGTNFAVTVPTSVLLQSLKILHLYWIEFSDDESLKRLFSGCHVLEELNMKGCVGENVHVINITALALKRLALLSFAQGNTFPSSFFGYSYKIVLNTPNLQFLDHDGYVSEGYSMENLHCLVKANLNLRMNRSRKLPASIYYRVMGELIAGISDVQFLCLSGDSVESLGHRPLLKFHKLTYLEISLERYKGLKLLPAFLGSSSQLQTLVFPNGFGRSPVWHPHREVPLCLLSHLKEIEIRSFLGKKVELDIVTYFLRKAQVLRKLTMSCAPWSAEQDLKICKQLLMLPRGSKRCQIVML